MPIILKGKPVADEIKERLKEEVLDYKKRGIAPTMAIIRVGQREDDIAYENSIIKNCDSIGIKVVVYEAPANISMEAFENLVKQVDLNDKIHGILVFRPLPKHLDMELIQSLVSPQKDIDCMNPINLQKVFEGDETGFKPCTPEAVIEILKYYKIPIEGAKTCIVNRSLVLGKPLAMMLLAENATVEICHSKTKNLAKQVSGAEIVITGTGKAKMFDNTYFNSGSVVIDVGINYEGDKMCGDVNYEDVADRVSAITPVPGGVGTVTSTILLKHVLQAVKLTNN
ncbi:MAG: bifunctional 5,10-methylenetetrahydrofolate dehydrogenase/5,10-methenyltetrahydrofolate cyclohydrolase [Clostridiales bacterium]|nr:bifunctional 5,10-methylenetetrahydrofolate dehydrogenase/5,10-methenyltetrahydrofolate cyclohydrolase [Clostridiales bacterium]